MKEMGEEDEEDEDEDEEEEDEEEEDGYAADLERGEEADFESISCLSPIVLSSTFTARSMFFDYEDEDEDEDDTPIQPFISQIVSLRITD